MDRDKALDLALANIEKQFGKGSLMRLGDEAAVQVPAIPSGALSLDIALGIGGLPRGRVVEIYGPESSGKCLTADTLVWTDHGLESLTELFARLGRVMTDREQVIDVRAAGVRLVNEHGQLERLAALTHNGRRAVRRVTLDSGRALQATTNHPLRVRDAAGHLVWRQVGALAVGDRLVSAGFGAEVAYGGCYLDEQDAALLGYLAGPAPHAGGWHGPQAIDERATLLMQASEGGARRDASVRTASSPEPVAVPHIVRTAGSKAQRAFLSALFEAGAALQADALVLSTPHERLATEAQLLLLGLGIRAERRLRATATHQLVVRGAALARFHTEVGLRSTTRQDMLSSRLAEAGTDATRTPEGAVGVVDEAIVAIEDAGIQPTFDVVLPTTHSFVANGVLSHNTTVALHAVAEAQKAGGIAAFIDAEHALDPTYARALGVDINELLVSQPDTGEQALEIADMLVRSAAVDIIVIDSVAALTPRAEIEGEMGDSHVGLQARLMSQALRKLAGSLKRSDTTAVFINQLREKVGVMFGCFAYDTPVTLADGTRVPIGEIVEQRREVEVLSYDVAADAFVPRPVVGWYDNGPTERFLHIEVARSGADGNAAMRVTPNHLVATPQGWVHAAQLALGDTVLQWEASPLTVRQRELVLGTLLGAGRLEYDGARTHLILRHEPPRRAHAEHLASTLAGGQQVHATVDAKGRLVQQLPASVELTDLHEAINLADTTVLSWEFLKALTPRALAVAYQDVGRFIPGQGGGAEDLSELPVAALERGSRRRLRDHLADTFDLHAELVEDTRHATLRFSGAASRALHERLAPWMHPAMAHLLAEDCRGDVAAEEARDTAADDPPQDVVVAAPVVNIIAEPVERERPHRYDLEVADTHTYLADGIVVHNSPETTPGGRALKFYSSVRLDVRRIETLKDGTEAVGNRVRVKVVKNKVAPPFRQAEFDIIYGEGISKEGSLIDVGVEEGIIRKAGAWYTYDGDQLGQGKEKARMFLKEHTDVAAEIEKKVKEKLGLEPIAASDQPIDEG